MKKILFPTDFSETAQHAFTYALHLADKLGAGITTLHAYQLPQVSEMDLTPELRNFYDNIDLYEFESYRDEIPLLVDTANARGFGHIDLQHVLTEGDPESAILEVAAADAVDLVVMGTTGARGLKEIFVGSTAGEVMEKAGCPVLIIPEKSTFDGKIDNIAFTTTFSEAEQQTLELVNNIFTPFAPRIHCLNVDLAHTETYTKRMDAFSAAFKSYDNMEFHVLDGTDIKEVIMNYLEEHAIDVLAMVTRERNFLEELFHYSKTKQMAYHARTPILALKAS